MNLIILAAVLLIISLSSYAGYLLLKLRQQTLRQQQNKQSQQTWIRERNATLAKHIDSICQTGLAKQCDLSEISIRICELGQHIQGCGNRINFEQDYPALFELYQLTKGMARAEDRSNIPRKERMAQDLTRMKAESRLESAIMNEMENLKKVIQPLNTNIDIKILN